MRWSQFICLTTLLLGVAVGEVLARSDDQWTRIIARSPGVTKSNKVSASSLKSSNYRKTAIKEGNVYDAAKKQVVKSQLTKAKVTGQHADHVFEAQTAAHVMNQHGIQPTASEKKAVKKILNGPGNLAMVDGDMNINKGSVTAAALKGNTGNFIPGTQDYMKSGTSLAMGTSGKLDNVFNKGPLFSDAQKDIHKNAGVRRRSIRRDVASFI